MSSRSIQVGIRSLLLVTGLPLAAQSVAGKNPFFIIAEQSRTAFTIQGTGARAVGLGGAFIAVADDATATSFNPAGLAQMLRPEVSLVGENLSRSQDFRNFARQDDTTSTFDDATTGETRRSPIFFSATFPDKAGGLNRVWQVSYQRILDLNYASDRNYKAKRPPGSTTTLSSINQNIDQKGGVQLWSLAYGAELTQRLLVGASLNYWRGNWDFTSSTVLNLEDAGGSFDIETDFIENNEFRGLNFNLGAIWRMDWIQLGMVYRSPFNADLTTRDRFVFEPRSNVPTTVSDEKIAYDLKWPETFGWGMAIRPHARLQVAADWNKTRWSRATLYSDRFPGQGLNFFDYEVASRTPDTQDFHAGIEWVAFLGNRVVLPLRFGGFKEPQPIVDGDTGQQRVFRGFSFGFGVKLQNFTLDLAYKSSKAERDIVRKNIQGIALDGTLNVLRLVGREELHERRIYLTTIYQFQTGRVHKALHWLFIGD